MPKLDIDATTAPKPLPVFKVAGLLNKDECWAWLKEQAGIVGWTFCYNRAVFSQISVARLIVCVGQPDTPNWVRYASNCHMKIYVGKTQALVGSFNLTWPTIEDAGILITKQSQVRALRQTFNKHWKHLA